MSQVVTTPHEIEGRWKWDGWGRGPYDALSSVMLGPPFEGYLELTIDVDDFATGWKSDVDRPSIPSKCRTMTTVRDESTIHDDQVVESVRKAVTSALRRLILLPHPYRRVARSDARHAECGSR